MPTKLEILNLALGKISPNRIVHDSPPRTSLEQYMVGNYPVWKKTELTKHRWVFATEDYMQLTLSATLDPEPADYRKYKFALPNDCLRPIRLKTSEWKQRGKFVYSTINPVTLSFIRDADENEFDPLFVDVLASWISYQACMFVTESNTKKEQQRIAYQEAKNLAKQANAYVTGPEDIQADDSDFTFLTSRFI